MAALLGLVNVVLGVMGLVSAVIYIWFKFSYTYWRRRGIKGPEPSFPSGNFQGVFTKNKHMSEPIVAIYDKYKSEPYVGIYSLYNPVLMVNDLDLIKNILIKDFDSFNSHGVFENEQLDPLSTNLFNLSGKRWRDVRTKLSSAFTSGKMKILTKIMLIVQEKLAQHIKLETEKSSIIDFKKTFGLYTMDIIGSCGFGLECDSFNNPDSKFLKYSKEGIGPTGIKDQITFMLNTMAPKVLELLRISAHSPKVIEFFTTLVTNTVRYREENNIKRNDLLEQLMQIKNNEIRNDNGELVTQTGPTFTTADIVAQAFVFVVAGYETSSSAISYALYCLARCPDVQQKAREEIRRVLAEHGGQCTYEVVQKLDYLGMVIDESLRMHPVVRFLVRKSTNEYRIPNSSLTIEKNTQIFVPVIGIHMDPDLYPEPHVFNPERFTKEEKAKRHKSAYLPFGEGPRICKGMRFAMIEVRLALVAVLADYEVSVCDQTKIPLELDVSAFVACPKDGVFLKVQKVP